MYTHFCSGNLKGKEYMGEQGTDGSVTSNKIWGSNAKVGSGLHWFRIYSNTGLWEHSNDSISSLKVKNFSNISTYFYNQCHIGTILLMVYLMTLSLFGIACVKNRMIIE
jgi:hypothetical protein